MKAHAFLTVFNTRRTTDCYLISKAPTRKKIKLVSCQILGIYKDFRNGRITRKSSPSAVDIKY